MIQESAIDRLSTLLGSKAFEYAVKLLLVELGHSENFKVEEQNASQLDRGFDLLLKHSPNNEGGKAVTAVEIMYFLSDFIPSSMLYSIYSRLINSGKLNGANKFLLFTNTREENFKVFLEALNNNDQFSSLGVDSSCIHFVGKESIAGFRAHFEQERKLTYKDDLLAVFNTLEMNQPLGPISTVASIKNVLLKL